MQRGSDGVRVRSEGLIKEKCRAERLMEWLQILMFMDDIVLLSTNRANMYIRQQVEDNEGILYVYGMRVNSAKTKLFFVNNDETGDKEAKFN